MNQVQVNTVQNDDGIYEITLKLSESQYEVFHRVAKLRDLENWQLLVDYVRIGLEADSDLCMEDMKGVIAELAKA